jgi:hypothetical protein
MEEETKALIKRDKTVDTQTKLRCVFIFIVHSLMNRQ